jgi:hypothetical protein
MSILTLSVNNLVLCNMVYSSNYVPSVDPLAQHYFTILTYA